MAARIKKRVQQSRGSRVWAIAPNRTHEVQFAFQGQPTAVTAEPCRIHSSRRRRMESMNRKWLPVLAAVVIIGAILAGVAFARRSSPQAVEDDAAYEQARALMVEDGIVAWGV